jgi:DNA-binding PadR family transcriptional regulator
VARVFKRGELKQAIVAILASVGEAHGYAIMAELKDRVGGRWKPSPGAIYPALLSLEELGLVRSLDEDGTKIYSLTEEGRKVASAGAASAGWAALAKRAQDAAPRTSLGSLLDTFAASHPERRKLVSEKQAKAVEGLLRGAAEEIEQALTEGEADG